MDNQSNDLFGRYQALRVYVAVGRLSKPEFATGQIVKATGVAAGVVSKELGRLSRLGMISATSRRGDYERVAVGPFWEAIELLRTLWE